MSTSVDPLADAVADSGFDPTWLFRTGKVTAVAGTRITVTVSGASMLLPYFNFGPKVNDTVVVLARPGAWIVLGSIAPGGTAPGGGGGSSAHTHIEGDVTSLVADLAGKAPTVHTHLQSEVSGLVSDLSGKASNASVAAKADAVHTHAEADVTGLTADLAGKAPTVHAHAQSDVTGLSTALSGKAATVHSHAQSDVTGLTTDLAAKVGTSDARLTDARAWSLYGSGTPTTGQVPAWNGSAYVPTTVSSGAAVPTAKIYSMTMPTAYTNVTAAYNAPQQMASLSIPDPGWPYILTITGMVIVRTGTAAGQRTDLSIRLDTITGTEMIHVTYPGITTIAANTFLQMSLNGGWPNSGTLTGAHTVILGAGMFPTPATGQVGGQAGFDGGNFVKVALIPA